MYQRFRDRYRNNLVAVTILATLATMPAMSQTLEWEWGDSENYHIGMFPAIGFDSGRVVAVHQDSNKVGTLSYRVGQLQQGIMNWGESATYDNGIKPSVALSASTVVEVHQAGAGVGPLWYRVGKIEETKVHWSDSHNHGVGLHPSVAMVGSIVVEVHQSALGVGPLKCRVGRVRGTAIDWGSPTQYDTGTNPSVASFISPNGVGVIEVHQAKEGVGPLWYRRGAIRNNVIHWSASFQYDNGTKPAVAAHSGFFLEVHQGQQEVGRLWYRVGRLTKAGRVQWAQSMQYENGLAPRVALESLPSGITATAVHQSGDGVGPLWWRGSVKK